MLQSGVIFRKSDKLGSRLIRWGTQESWSHVGVIFDSRVYHSDSKGCHFSTLEEFSHDAETFFLPREISDEQKARAYEALGQKYDWPALVWFAVLFLLRRILIRLPEYTINPKWKVCSEYATWILWGKVETHTPGEILSRLLETPV